MELIREYQTLQVKLHQHVMMCNKKYGDIYDVKRRLGKAICENDTPDNIRKLMYNVMMFDRENKEVQTTRDRIVQLRKEIDTKIMGDSPVMETTSFDITKFI